MGNGATTPSPQLAEANRQLDALRKQFQAQRLTRTGQPSSPAASSPSPAPEFNRSAPERDNPGLPAHLGWGSETLSALLRAPAKETPAKESAAAAPPAAPQNDIPPETGRAPQPILILDPDIGLGMLRRGAAAAGRLWLALRYLDQPGRGVLRIDLIRKELTGKDSPLRLCGQRQLRNLLREGEGIFWTRDKERVWLRSASKTAAALGVERLRSRPVELPLATLLNGIGSFRAHLYAAFHSGRAGEGGEMGRPIARQTLSRISGAARRTQQNYEKRAGVRRQTNYALGETASGEHDQERGWRQGPALFYFHDSQGRQGAPRRVYLAWQLPNSYHAPHVRRSRGRQRRINRELAVLRMKRGAGNGQEKIEARRYHAHGAQAGKAYNQEPERDHYWPQKKTGRDKRFWRLLAGRGK